ncbi:MAG: CHAT domain-containing tetratricopeptide repeat protein [Vicinamibacterales bacterium]
MPPSTAVLAIVALLAQAPAAADPLAGINARAARGDFAGAIDDAEHLLATASDRARVLYLLARLEQRTGRLDRAVGHARDAAAAFVASNRPTDASDAWNLAAMAEFTRGNFGAAAAHLGQAIGLATSAGDIAKQAEQTGNLGSVYFSLGRYDDAASAFGRARAQAVAHAAEPWAAPRLAVLDANDAALLQRLGRYAEALDRYRRMVDENAAMPPSQRGQVLVNQGALFRRLGDPYKALDAYDRARADFAADREPAGEASVLTNRGIALALDLARYDDAITAFTDALGLASAGGNRREALLAQLYRGEAARLAGRLDAAAADFAAATRLADDLHAPDEAWKARYGAGRVARAAGRVDAARAAFDDAIGLVDSLREQLAVPSTRLEFFRDKREVYDARIGLGLGADDATTTFTLIEQGRARAWRDRLQLPAPTIAGVRAALPPGAVLLAYWMGDDGAAVVRLTHDDARVVPLRIPVEAIAALDRALRDPASDAWQQPATTLGAAVLPPGLLDDATTVVVVPDGPLGAVPFDALIVDGAPLVARAAVSTLPTAALLTRPAPGDRGWRAPWTLQLAAFGDPRPGDDTWAGGQALPRLPASAAEVAAIASTLGGAHRLFLGEADTKRALLDELRQPPPVLHVATHATADLAAGEESRLLFSPSAGGHTADALFLREVYTLTLTGVDLVVLSACETERGPDVRGEGVQGFSRALLAAGARRAITTLWRVPDQPTAALMQSFYDEVQAGRPLDLALTAAKRTVMTQRTTAHPHYWAGFVLTGATDPLPRAVRWRDVIGAGLMAAGVLGLAIAWRRRAKAR